MKIVRTKRYLKDLKRIGASASDVTALEEAIARNPMVGDVIQGLGGIRKLRFGLGNRGKRGGARAIYFLMVADDVAVMLFRLREKRTGRFDQGPAQGGARDNEGVLR